MAKHSPKPQYPWQANSRLVFAAVILSAFFIVFPGASTEVVAQSGDQLLTGYVGPSITIQAQPASQPPALSDSDLLRLQSLALDHHLRGPATRASVKPQTRVSRLPVESTTPQPLGVPAADPLSGNNFTFYANNDLGDGAPTSRTSLVGEPSVGNTGSLVFQTGNWYAALSSDNGNSFSYVDPTRVFPSAYGGFCCDQSVLYEPSRDILVWMMIYSGNETGNIIRLGIANGQSDLAHLRFHYFDLAPQVLGFRRGDWYDYPSMAAGTDYLYVSTNIFTRQKIFDGTVILRLPLDALAQTDGFLYTGYKLDASRYFNATLTQGASDTMYWATHADNGEMRVYAWREGASPTGVNIEHTTYPSAYDYACPSPGGRDWCGRVDDRVMTGWVSNGILGFMWNAPQGSGGFGTFAYPYVQVLFVNENSMTVYGESVMSNAGYAFVYPAAGVNARGHVAGSVFYGGGSVYPSLATFIWDDVSPKTYPTPPTRWETYTAATSTQGPTSDYWGDYLSAHQNDASISTRYLWIASGYVLTGNSSNGGTNSNARPRFLSFGRQRDNPRSEQGTATIYYFPWVAK